MKKFGIRFEGLEEPVEEILKNHIKDKKEYTYLEIGVASCQTFRAIYDILKENISTGGWLCIGLDLVGSDNVNFRNINSLFSSEELLVEQDALLSPKILTGEFNAVLVLKENPREWISNIKDEKLDFVFIDGCHGSKCVFNDFIAIENKVKSGGLVAFHDCGIEETGTDWQSHCGENINVRKALQDLNLLNGPSRNGWTLIKEIAGTRKTNNDSNGGNSIIFFQKL